MSAIIYDTSIFIGDKPTNFPADFLLSAVVLQELVAGAADKSEIQLWEAIRRRHEKQGTLLTPDGSDWWEAGRVLNALLRGLKSQHQGQTPKLPANEKQRIIRDVLIARTVKRINGLLVTNNVKDFTQIKRFCNLRFRSGEAYFKV